MNPPGTAKQLLCPCMDNILIMKTYYCLCQFGEGLREGVGQKETGISIHFIDSIQILSLTSVSEGEYISLRAGPFYGPQEAVFIGSD